MEHIVPEFEVGHSSSIDAAPDKWYAAQVPGAVQLDYARAHDLSPYWVGENFLEYGWMEDAFWHYRTSLDGRLARDDDRVYFVSQGIDYECSVFLNGVQVAHHVGMFSEVRIDLTNHIKPDEGNELRIVCFPIPRKPGAPAGRWEAADSCKAHVSYGWDWHPRLVPVGIWDETRIEVGPPSALIDVDVYATVTRDLSSGLIAVRPTFAGDLRPYTVAVTDPNGRLVATVDSQDAEARIDVPSPQLWWPMGEGRQDRYEVSVSPVSGAGQSRVQRVGFRSVKLVMNEGAWDEPSGFPKTRSTPPITLEVNGRRIFARGSNWVPPDVFFGSITADRYETMVRRAVEANFNIVRIWGGGIANKDVFYELCDEHGLMVWQEFPLACAEHSDDPAYLSVLEAEATAIVLRLRSHPSLVMWCGGNELFNSWTGMTDQHHALRLLGSITYELDRGTPYLPTSPVYGMAHGHYVFHDRDTDEEVFAVMARSANTAYTEFGMPSASPIAVLETFMSPEELAAPGPGGVWESHHAYGAWKGGGPDTWLCESTLRTYFGEDLTTERLVFYSQLLQSVGYQAIFEEARRQWPACSMALHWCFNEPWPAAANNSLIAWPDVPKPAYWFVQASCRPVAASAAIRRFSYAEGEELECDVWLINDSPGDVEALDLVVTVQPARAREGAPADPRDAGSPGRMFATPVSDPIEVLHWHTDKVPCRTNLHGPTARWTLPALDADLLILRISSPTREDAASEYLLQYSRCPAADAQASTPRGLNM